jgi:dolichol-phosphate mannosyltransferase
MSARDLSVHPDSLKDPPAAAGGPALELSVVIPVYNEAEAVTGVLDEWLAELERLGVRFEVAAYDDGSSDGSLALLETAAAGEPRLRVVSHPNRGHGPTILRGYHEATGEWIFQTDSDGELTPEEFESLWRQREGFDFLVGYRQGRRSSPSRAAVTVLSRLVVAMLFGRRIRDVNAPYRLMRRSSLMPLLAYLPEDAFAPNVLLSGLVSRKGLRVTEAPVAQRPRRGGQGSLTSKRLWRGVFKTLRDAIHTSRRAPRRSP